MKTLSYFLILAFSGGEHAGGGSPLDVNPGLILWTVVTFIFLLLILKKLAWKPILNSLNERENLIKESLEKAEVARKEAEKLIAENKLNMQKAEEEAQKIIEQSRDLAEKLKAQILDESKKTADKMLQDAKAEIERKNSEAFVKLKEQVADIAINAAEKILKENLDKNLQLKIVDKYLDEINKN
ncbi:MAG: F0F1 ATP synthase subunit B [Melioribacteraceae bacterium]|nr:F0F1 ATP synthase subunit B [Melioribacteraceae bacterium]